MKGLLSYSGIAAKVKAMEGKLITGQQLKTMAELESVPDAVGFLRALTPYKDILSGLDDEELHRGTIERRLTDCLYRDYTKLYRFADLKQRQFLNFYFLDFERDILKNCLRNAVAHEAVPLGLAPYEDFFKKHSKVDLVRISCSENLEDFIDNLAGTDHYSIFNSLRESKAADYFDYEMALDLYYFKHAWGMIKKMIPKSEQKSIYRYFGTKLDLLNLQWIYRSKRYFSSSADSIRELLIPMGYSLKKAQLDKLIKADTIDDFFTELNSTRYGNQIRKSDLTEKPDLETLYDFVLNHMHHTGTKQNPYSMSILYSYFYFKERELKKIITIVECIRYKVDVGEINSYIGQY